MAIEIFIGSSSEAKKVDREIRTILEGLGVKAIGWREIFKPGDYPIDILLATSKAVDGALLILTPDDIREFRQSINFTPRDNVVLELGIFLSSLGKDRAAIIHVTNCGKEIASLPTDLKGLTNIIYDPEKPAQNESNIAEWAAYISTQTENNESFFKEKINFIRESLIALPFGQRQDVQRYLIDEFNYCLTSAINGCLPVTPSDYYFELNRAIDSAGIATEIFAVATLSSKIWNIDKHQRHYLDKNLGAAKRGAKIKRLFILPDVEWDKIGNVLKSQIEHGMEIRRSPINEAVGLKDMVIIKNKKTGKLQGFLTEQAVNNHYKVEKGSLISNVALNQKLLFDFDRVWSGSQIITQNELPDSCDQENAFRISPPTPPPGQHLKSFKLENSVISCAEAAREKGISLANELKTLILDTSKGFVAVHLPGDAELCLRSTKRTLSARESYLAAPEQLQELGLQRGAVSAVHDPVWNMHHLISRRIVAFDFVSTNNGTFNGYHKFEPELLFEAESYTIGDFEKS